ncbi:MULTISPECIES: methionine aminotransferase [Chitinophagaceae]
MFALPYSKLPNVGLTIFSEMSQLAAQYNAINLGQGFPDYPMDAALIDQVTKAMKDGHNQYTHTDGYLPLRERLAQKAGKLYHSNIDPDTQITITPGGTYAIYSALTSILLPGDEVIVFEPAYDSYVPNIEINQAKPVLVRLEAPSYSIPWGVVREKITSKTKAIILNSPHNPTGSLLSEEDMLELRRLTSNTSIVIIMDEVYEHLVYQGRQHQSLLCYPDLLERGFAIFSFGKTYNCTGWKLGYAISGERLMKEFRKVHQFNCFSCFSPLQVALSVFLENEAAYLDLWKKMQAKRDFLLEKMKTTEFEPLPSFGSYFQCYQYKGDRKETGIALAKIVTQEKRVATIPISAFYHNGGEPNQILRFCFCKRADTLEEAAFRLSR